MRSGKGSLDSPGCLRFLKTSQFVAGSWQLKAERSEVLAPTHPRHVSGYHYLSCFENLKITSFGHRLQGRDIVSTQRVLVEMTR